MDGGSCSCPSGYTGIKCEIGDNINMRIVLIYYHHSIRISVKMFYTIFVYVFFSSWWMECMGKL